MLRQKMRSNIWKLHGFWFFHNLIFAYVIERLFAQQRHITIQQMVYLEILFAVIVMVLEVPTGALADRWSRKNMMVLSGIFSFFEFFILIFAFNFTGFALSAVTAGLQSAFKSGTSNALLFDSLKSIGEEKEFEKVIGRNRFIDYTAGVIAALLGGLIASGYSYVSAYWLSLISEILALVCIIALHEPERFTDVDTENVLYLEHIKNAFIFLKGHRNIKIILFFGVVLGAAANFVDEYWQLYSSSIGIPVAAFGIVSAIYLFLHSGAALFASRVKQLLGYRVLTMGIAVASGCLLLVAGFTKSIFGVLPILAVSCLYGFVQPLVSGYLHHETESYHRATVESFQSLALMLAVIPVGLGFGWISTKLSIFWGMKFLGLIILGYVMFHVIEQFGLAELQENQPE